MARASFRLALSLVLTLAFFAVGASKPAAAAGPAWWNASYSDRLAINVHANDAINSGYSLDVIVNHARMVSQGVSLASGDDVRIAYWNGTSWTELDRVLAWGSSWNNASTDLVFKTVAAVSANSDDTSYYLYYGNAAAVTPPANANNVYALWDDFSAPTLDTTKWNKTNITGSAAVSTTSGEASLTAPEIGPGGNNYYGIATASTSFGAGYRYDSTVRIPTQSAAAAAAHKILVGLNETDLGVKNSQIAYYGSGIWQSLGTTSLAGQVVAATRISQTLTATQITDSENGVLKAQRNISASNSAAARWYYGPEVSNAGSTFDVRIDDVDIRKYVNNEPRVSVEGANDIAFVASVAPIFSFTVASHIPAAACNGATQTTSASTTGAAVALGRLNSSTPSIAVQDLSVTSNAQTGFFVGVRSSGAMAAGANTIADLTNTNAAPAAFPTGAGFGYTTDALARFASKWAGFTSTSNEVLSGTGPLTSSGCVAYKLQVAATTPAASYATNVIYTAVPTF